PLAATRLPYTTLFRSSVPWNYPRAGKGNETDHTAETAQHGNRRRGCEHVCRAREDSRARDQGPFPEPAQAVRLRIARSLLLPAQDRKSTRLNSSHVKI